MVLWVKSPRVASSDCASNPMPILIRLKAPATSFCGWYSYPKCSDVLRCFSDIQARALRDALFEAEILADLQPLLRSSFVEGGFSLFFGINREINREYFCF